MRAGVAIGLALLLAGCVFKPKFAGPTNSACELVTEKMTIEVWKGADGQPIVLAPSGSGSEAEAAVAILVPAGSLLVSGGIVVVNNTAYFLEYQGRCSESELRQGWQKLKSGLGAAGGKTVEYARGLEKWFQGDKNATARFVPDAAPKSNFD